MQKKGFIYAIGAAVLFGLSTPLTKLIIGNVEPLIMSGMLYLGTGLGLLIVNLFSKTKNNLERKDLGWLAGAVIAGGIIAPFILMVGLKNSPASTASLLLNFEAVATTLIAVMIFREKISRKVFLALAAITTASIILSWNPEGNWGFSLGALGVLGACFFWGLDNNFTKQISGKSPLMIVMIKGLAAGSFSLLLGLGTGNQLPDIKTIIFGMLVGFFCYGVSIVFFILSLRALGAAKTGTWFAIAPFIGSLLSFIIFLEAPNMLFLISLPFMIAGVYLLVKEENS